MITADRLRAFAPSARADITAALIEGWPKVKAKGVNTPLRLAHFLAQIATETGGFTIYTENLNYSATRLCEVWPSHFRSIAEATPFAHNPSELANYIYADANRSPGYRLGNTQPGDGWRYIGRGLIQTTGRDGYRKAGHENDPEALVDPKIGLDAALDEFVRSGCLPFADADDVVSVRKRINGGLNGIADCRVFLARAKAIFTPMADPIVPPLPELRPTAPVPPTPIVPPTPPAPPAPPPAPTVPSGSIVVKQAPPPAPALTLGNGLILARIKAFFRSLFGS